MKSGVEVFTIIRDTVSKVMNLYPEIKLIISEVTPRMDELDCQVQEANILLNELVESCENLFIVRNSNLRNQDFFNPDDPKHIRKTCIGRFAANIKIALRRAYGIKYDRITNSYSNERDLSQNYSQQCQFRNNQLSPEDIPRRNTMYNCNEEDKLRIFKNELLRSITASISEAFLRVGT